MSDALCLSGHWILNRHSDDIRPLLHSLNIGWIKERKGDPKFSAIDIQQKIINNGDNEFCIMLDFQSWRKGREIIRHGELCNTNHQFIETNRMHNVIEEEVDNTVEIIQITDDFSTLWLHRIINNQGTVLILDEHYQLSRHKNHMLLRLELREGFDRDRPDLVINRKYDRAERSKNLLPINFNSLTNIDLNNPLETGNRNGGVLSHSISVRIKDIEEVTSYDNYEKLRLPSYNDDGDNEERKQNANSSKNNEKVKPFKVYLIEVNIRLGRRSSIVDIDHDGRTTSSKSISSSHIICRRYREFDNLRRSIKEVKSLNWRSTFPPKRWRSLSGDDLTRRKNMLEDFLSELMEKSTQKIASLPLNNADQNNLAVISKRLYASTKTVNVTPNSRFDLEAATEYLSLASCYIIYSFLGIDILSPTLEIIPEGKRSEWFPPRIPNSLRFHHYLRFTAHSTFRTRSRSSVEPVHLSAPTTPTKGILKNKESSSSPSTPTNTKGVRFVDQVVDVESDNGVSTPDVYRDSNERDSTVSLGMRLFPQVVEEKEEEISTWEEFQKQLKDGVTIIKHCRWSKPKDRIIWCDEFDEGGHLFWRDAKQQRITASPSFIFISDIYDIRKGTTPDPKNRSKCGTKVLRRYVNPSNVGISFSLITPSRTFDIECESQEQYDLIYNGFNQLLREIRT